MKRLIIRLILLLLISLSGRHAAINVFLSVGRIVFRLILGFISSCWWLWLFRCIGISSLNNFLLIIATLSSACLLSLHHRRILLFYTFVFLAFASLLTGSFIRLSPFWFLIESLTRAFFWWIIVFIVLLSLDCPCICFLLIWAHWGSPLVCVFSVLAAEATLISSTAFTTLPLIYHYSQTGLDLVLDGFMFCFIFLLLLVKSWYDPFQFFI